MKEIWRDIKGYEGLYQVSSLGRIRSLNYNHSGKEKILKAKKDRYGYLRINLYKDGKVKNYKVHRLVAEAFIPNPDSLPCINHKNEFDKTDNRAEALEWCDHKYNNSYGTRIQRIAEKNTNGKCSKPVLQFDLHGNFIKEWPSTMEIERSLGYRNGCIGRCCQGKRNSAFGFKWRYAA